MIPKYFDNKGRLNDVVIIRSLAIIMVVAFHAYYMMMVEGHFPASAQMYHSMYFNLNCMILQFRMPLFIFISGYLFSHLENDRGKYSTFKGLFTNKFKRLIIPFFVFATVFMISINNFSWRPYYAWGYEHLWFIPMLFWCFVFTRIQSFAVWSKSSLWKIGMLSVFLVFNIIPQIQMPMLALPNFLKWYFWFYFGYQLYLKRDAVYHALNMHKIVFTILLISTFAICVLAKCTLLNDNAIHTWYTELGNIAIVLLLWYWINNLLINKLLSGGGKNIRKTQQIQLWHLCVPQLASAVHDKQHSNSFIWFRCYGDALSHLVPSAVYRCILRSFAGSKLASAKDPCRALPNRVNSRANFRYDIAVIRLLCM